MLNDKSTGAIGKVYKVYYNTAALGKVVDIVDEVDRHVLVTYGSRLTDFMEKKKSRKSIVFASSSLHTDAPATTDVDKYLTHLKNVRKNRVFIERQMEFEPGKVSFIMLQLLLL